MITFKNAALFAGTKCLFEKSSFMINAGYRVGIVGSNGSGKTTLLHVLNHSRTVDDGICEVNSRLRIAEVEQEIHELDLGVIEYVMQGDTEWHRTTLAIETAERNDNASDLATLHAHLESIDGYTVRHRAAKLLHGLSFSNDGLDKKLREYSGGWQMRANLARALMKPSDLLLLDEPTNHLDLDAVIWLADWLKQYRGILIVISHDREFLDDVTDHILAIENRIVRLYTGNYSSYETQRFTLLEQQQALFEKQQRKIEHLTDFINRFRAKATKAKQAQARIKWLEKIDRVLPVYQPESLHFRFSVAGEVPELLYTIKNGSTGYQGKTLLNNLNLVIRAGDRIGLLGHNGAGKSTLIKLIGGGAELFSGERSLAKDLRIGYFAQHQLDQLDLDASPLLHFTRLDSKAREEDLRTYLGVFDFSGDRATENIRVFSGGEKARLALALLLYQKPNLLLLDEPTNHLDMDMRQALTIALQDFKGAMIIISHDRHFLRANVDEFYLIGNGTLQSYDGDLNDYQSSLLSSQKTSTELNATSKLAGDKKERKREEAEQRQKLYPIKKQIQLIENDINKHQSRLEAIEQQLSSTDIYQENKKIELKNLLREQTEYKQKLDELELQWLELNEQLEHISRS